MTTTGISLDLAQELRAICGDNRVRERPTGGMYVSPSSAGEVAAVLALANRHGLSLSPAGGSTERNAAEVHVDILLHTNRLANIEHYDHGDLTVGVGSGMTISELSAMLAPDRLMFAGDPPCPERCTIGGLLATASHGPLRHGYGSVRDYCIGIRFVTGDGRRAKGGGRVVKNVAGYDLMKLLIGSYGTLAVITSASFKLFPAPRQTRTFLAEFSTANEAMRFRDRVMHSPLSPMCMELVSPAARKLLRPETNNDAWLICVRASGSDAVLNRYRKELGSAATREIEGDSERRIWTAIENFGYTDPDDSSSLIYLSAWPREVNDVIDTLLATSALAGVDTSLIGRVGVGLLLARVTDRKRTASEGTCALVHALRGKYAERLAVKVRGATNPWPLTPANIASMKAVKHALDPNNVLRGRQIA